MQIQLVDCSAQIVEAWQRHFSACPNVVVRQGNILHGEATAIVSPANSFGFMDGGIDLAYSEFFGWDLQERLQLLIRDQYAGELPVGQAVVVPTNSACIPFLISAPTMRVPLDIRGTANAFLAFRAAILAARAWRPDTAPITSLLCPGLGTGVGLLEPAVCARQMHLAYSLLLGNLAWAPRSLGQATELHFDLVSPQRVT
jgi:O-acetyl-ADP-ribose deacetylase (regulator of RNase III)